MDEFERSDEELIEAELVEAASRRELIVQRAVGLVPVAKTAAVATVGVAVGAATAVVVAKAASSPTGRRLIGRRSGTRVESIESTTSYLIDIHRLARQ